MDFRSPMQTYPTMNSDHTDLDELASLWHDVPMVDAVLASAQSVLAVVLENPPERTTTGFNQLLIRTAEGLVAAAGFGAMDECMTLGQAVVWLSDMGVLEDLHVAFVEGEPNAAENVIVALRDACIGQLQADYRRYLMARYCAEWDVRHAVAAQWIMRQSPESVDGRQVWEFTENVDEMLESVGAANRLVGHLRAQPKS